jgi:hypothetical protein
MPSARFEVVCEVQPATRPDLMQVRHQIGVLNRLASGFLICIVGAPGRVACLASIDEI